MAELHARLMKPLEVARLFDVKPATVVRWARNGKIPALRTPGGQQYRFRPNDMIALLESLATSDNEGADWPGVANPS